MWENRCKVAISGVGFSDITRSAEAPLATHALQATNRCESDFDRGSFANFGDERIQESRKSLMLQPDDGKFSRRWDGERGSCELHATKRLGRLQRLCQGPRSSSHSPAFSASSTSNRTPKSSRR